MSKDSEIGIIKWFNQEKKFGLIGAPNKEDYFLYYTNAVDPETTFKGGMVVHFEKGYDEKRDKKMAYMIRPLKIDDYGAVIQLLGKDSKIVAERNSRKTRYGGKRELDIFIHASKLLFQEKTEEEIVEFILRSFQYAKDSKANLIAPFCKKLTTLLNKYTLFDKSDIVQIYNQVEEKLDEETLILLWREGFYDDFPREKGTISIDDYLRPVDSDSLKELPLEVKKFVKYAELLSVKDILKLKEYNIGDEKLLEIIENKFRNVRIEVDDLEKLKDLFKAFDSISKQVFQFIRPQLNDEIIFNAWKKREVKIDFEKETISTVFYQGDYKINSEIFGEFADELAKDEMLRISKVYDDSDKILNELLLKILASSKKSMSIGEICFAADLIEDTDLRNEVQKSLVDSFDEHVSVFLLKEASELFLKECLQIIEEFDQPKRENHLNLFEKAIKHKKTELNFNNVYQVLDRLDKDIQLNYYREHVEGLSDKDKLKFLKAWSNQEIQKLTLEHWKFEIFNVTKELLKKIPLEIMEENEAFKNSFTAYLDKINVRNSQVLHADELFETAPLEFLKKELIHRLPSSDLYKFDALIDQLDETERKEILESLYEEATTLSTRDFIYTLEVLSSKGLNFSPVFIKNHLSNLNVNDLNTLLSQIEKLKSVDEKACLDGLTKLIEKKKDELPLLEIIQKIDSPRVIAKALEHYLFDENVRLSELLKESDSLKGLSASLMEEVLANILNQFPYDVISFTVQNYPDLTLDLAFKIEINTDNITSVLNIIDKGIIDFTISGDESDFFVLKNFIEDCQLNANVKDLNKLLKTKNYSIQLILFKYLTYLHHKGKLPKPILVEVLKSIDTVQLSSLFVSRFITSDFKNRDQLMNVMNRLLKEHFNLLKDRAMTQETFDQVFSLRGLVKKCNGREKLGGVNFWQGGNHTRYYTEGDHYTYTDEVLDIYCEGRFWKEQQLYDSQSNKSTDESYNFYWCKNDYCVGINDEVDLSLSFQEWTLNELNELFQKQLDRLVFTHLAGWLNRMDTILDKLNCYSCKELLRPKNYVPSQLGYYAVPLFNCINENCEKHGNTIRFTHCRGCKKILDSRECETCNQCNWLICDNPECGKCGCGANYDPKYVEY